MDVTFLRPSVATCRTTVVTLTTPVTRCVQRGSFITLAAVTEFGWNVQRVSVVSTDAPEEQPGTKQTVDVKQEMGK